MRSFPSRPEMRAKLNEGKSLTFPDFDHMRSWTFPEFLRTKYEGSIHPNEGGLLHMGIFMRAPKVNFALSQCISGKGMRATRCDECWFAPGMQPALIALICLPVPSDTYHFKGASW